MRRLLWLALLIAPLPTPVRAAEVIPPAPPAHFNDYAGLVRPGTAQALDAQLAQFERDTSDQIVVAIYPKMQSDSSIEDYTVRVAQAWKAGRKGRDNGAALFVFAQDHTLYIQTGYGLEGALPDALCRRIIDDEIVPRIRAGDFDGGMEAGVRAIMAAVRGEYRGTGRTVAEESGAAGAAAPFIRIFAALGFLVLWSIIRSRQHIVYRGNGRRTVWGGNGPWIFPAGGSWGGGGGGFSGGGFSGGGGGFGGGGAGGRW